MRTIDRATKPKPLELWMHESKGPVAILANFTHNESTALVCESGRRTVVHHELLVGMFELDETKTTALRLHCRNGTIVEIPPVTPEPERTTP